VELVLNPVVYIVKCYKESATEHLHTLMFSLKAALTFASSFCHTVC